MLVAGCLGGGNPLPVLPGSTPTPEVIGASPAAIGATLPAIEPTPLMNGVSPLAIGASPLPIVATPPEIGATLTPVLKVTVTAPNTVADTSASLAGKLSGFPNAAVTVELYVHPLDGTQNYWYAQRSRAAQISGNNWDAEGQFGVDSPARLPLEYRVFAVVVDKTKVDNLPGRISEAGENFIQAVDEQDFRQKLKPFGYQAVDGAISPGFTVTRVPTPLAAQKAAQQSKNVFIPEIMDKSCSPQIEFTFVPPLGNLDNLRGRVDCIQPADYRVAVFIFATSWFTKPFYDQPLTTIQLDGSWTADITTGRRDEQATRIAAFLVPAGYSPPLVKGELILPAELTAKSLTHLIVDRDNATRQITFSGRTWNVRRNAKPSDPGPNTFSDGPEDVWVDSSGFLHLSLVYRNGIWQASEVESEDILGYGTYSFVLGSPVDRLDPNVVLGLFTWDATSTQYAHREIDIELSRWGNANSANAQYVVQPFAIPGNRTRFFLNLNGPVSTQRFVWGPNGVDFSSYAGVADAPDRSDLYQVWTYKGSSLPAPGQARAHLNLWLMDGRPPMDGQQVEVIIQSFTFTPLNK